MIRLWYRLGARHRVLLLLWITVVWVLWALAATLQTRLTDARDPLPNGQQRGMSVLPVIPLFPAALWRIALLIDRFFRSVGK